MGDHSIIWCPTEVMGNSVIDRGMDVVTGVFSKPEILYRGLPTNRPLTGNLNCLEVGRTSGRRDRLPSDNRHHYNR